MLPLTVAAMCDMVEDYTKGAAGTGIGHVRAGYSRFLAGLIPGSRPPRTRVWSFLRPFGELSVPATISGTATGVYDGSLYTVITATPGVFQPCHVGDTITIATVGEYTVAGYTSSTVVYITGNHAFADKAVTLPHSGMLDLPSDFGGLVGELRYGYNAADKGPPLELTDPDAMLDLMKSSNTPSDPRYAAVVPATFSAGTGQRWRLWLWPRPDTARILFYRYIRIASDITDSDTYCLGSPRHDETIRQAALADAEQKMGHRNGYYEDQFNVAMLTSIENDRLTRPTRVLSVKR